MENLFGSQKRFACVAKLFVSHYSILSNFGKVVIFRLFVKILTDIPLLLKFQEAFLRPPFCMSILKFRSAHYCSD